MLGVKLSIGHRRLLLNSVLSIVFLIEFLIVVVNLELNCVAQVVEHALLFPHAIIARLYDDAVRASESH